MFMTNKGSYSEHDLNRIYLFPDGNKPYARVAVEPSGEGNEHKRSNDEFAEIDEIVDESVVKKLKIEEESNIESIESDIIDDVDNGDLFDAPFKSDMDVKLEDDGIYDFGTDVRNSLADEDKDVKPEDECDAIQIKAESVSKEEDIKEEVNTDVNALNEAIEVDIAESVGTEDFKVDLEETDQEVIKTETEGASYSDVVEQEMEDTNMDGMEVQVDITKEVGTTSLPMIVNTEVPILDFSDVGTLFTKLKKLK